MDSIDQICARAHSRIVALVQRRKRSEGEVDKEAREVFQAVIDYPMSPEEARDLLQAMGKLALYGVNVSRRISLLKAEIVGYERKETQKASTDEDPRPNSLDVEPGEE